MNRTKTYVMGLMVVLSLVTIEVFCWFSPDNLYTNLVVCVNGGIAIYNSMVIEIYH